MNRTRTTVRTGAAASVLVLALGLTACSDSDEPSSGDRAGERTSDAATPAPSEPAGSRGAEDASEAPADDATLSGPEGPGGEETGWVLADELDTNAPVDATSLPDGVTVEQVADARRAWNGRADQLSGDEPCAIVGSVWIGATGGAGGTKTVVVGPQEGKAASCDGEPLMKVDGATNSVLEGAEFAALL